jgi:hypothetical protein
MLAALRHVWRTLQPLRVPMALMGGIALARWKYARATRDIDVLVGATDVAAKNLVATLTASGLRYKDARSPIRLGQLELFQFLYQPPDEFIDIQIDLLLGSGPYHHLALARRSRLHVDETEFEFDVLACEDLIIHKLLAGRMIDLADTAALLARNCESLDYPYMAEWLAKLDMLPPFKQCWHSARPDEPLPPAFTS